MGNFLVNQVKGLIVSGLKEYAKELNCSLKDVGLIIYTKDDSGEPLVKLFKKSDGKITPVRDTSFKEMSGKMVVPILFRAAFSVEKDLPIWLKKFINKSSTDKQVNIKTASYFLMWLEDDSDLHAFMYVNWKPYPDGKQNEVTLDYILETT